MEYKLSTSKLHFSCARPLDEHGGLVGEVMCPSRGSVVAADRPHAQLVLYMWSRLTAALGHSPAAVVTEFDPLTYVCMYMVENAPTVR